MTLTKAPPAFIDEIFYVGKAGRDVVVIVNVDAAIKRSNCLGGGIAGAINIYGAVVLTVRISGVLQNGWFTQSHRATQPFKNLKSLL